MKLLAAIFALLRTALIVAMQYRASFWGEASMALLWTAWTVLPLVVVYDQTAGVAGWTRQQSLLVVGFFIIMDGVLSAFVEPNLRAVVEHVRKGTLDFVLLKPIDAQLMVSLHRTAPTKLPHALAGLALVLWVGLPMRPAPLDWFSSFVLLVAGLAILHAIWTLVVCTSFWFVRVDNLSYLLRSVLDAGRWPVSFYRGGIRFLLTFVLPVGLMTTWPALALRGALAPSALALSLGLALAFTALARVGWSSALRHYSSASS